MPPVLCMREAFYYNLNKIITQMLSQLYQFFNNLDNVQIFCYLTIKFYPQTKNTPKNRRFTPIKSNI